MSVYHISCLETASFMIGRNEKVESCLLVSGGKGKGPPLACLFQVESCPLSLSMMAADAV